MFWNKYLHAGYDGHMLIGSIILISVYDLYFKCAILTTTYHDTCHNKEEMRPESSLYNVCNELCVLFSKVIVHYQIRCVA